MGGTARVPNTKKDLKLFEIIVVFFFIGIMAPLAFAKYIDVTDVARNKIIVSQATAVKERLKNAVVLHLLNYDGELPQTGRELIAFANMASPGLCPPEATDVGEFNLQCSGTADQRLVTITINSFRGENFPTPKAIPFNF